MSLRRFNPRRDAAEPKIIVAMRRAGASVQQLSGKHLPDLLVGWRGLTLLMEVKTPKPPLKRKPRKAPTNGQNDGQREWSALWHGGPVHVVTTPQEALAVLLAPSSPGRALPEIEP